MVASVDPTSYDVTASQDAILSLILANPEYSSFCHAISARADNCDQVSFVRVIQKVVARHAALRTIFVHTNKADTTEPPVWKAVESTRDADVEIILVDGNSVDAKIREITTTPFDVTSSVFRARLLKVRDSSEQHIVIALHRIVADPWSMAVLLDDFRLLYHADKFDPRLSIAPLSLQFSDFANWIEMYNTSPEGSQLVMYWKKQLAGAFVSHANVT